MVKMYKTVQELMRRSIDRVEEDSDNFYVSLTEDRENETIWQVNKKTKDVTFQIYPPLEMLLNGNTKTVKTSDFKRMMA